MADICRCLHNFNGVLQVCAAFTNSSVFRLKDTWKRISKTVELIYPIATSTVTLTIILPVVRDDLKAAELGVERWSTQEYEGRLTQVRLSDDLAIRDINKNGSNLLK